MPWRGGGGWAAALLETGAMLGGLEGLVWAGSVGCQP